MNLVVLSGMVVKPLTYRTVRDIPITDFLMKVESGHYPRREELIIRTVAFNRNAVKLNEWCRCGDWLLVRGRLRHRHWKDKKGVGRTNYSVVIHVFERLYPPPSRKSKKAQVRPASPKWTDAQLKRLETFFEHEPEFRELLIDLRNLDDPNMER